MFESRLYKDQMVIERKKELFQILIGLISEGKKLAKILWQKHTCFRKCKCCNTLSKYFVRDFFSNAYGYDEICNQCDDKIRKEYYKNRKNQ